MAHVEGFSDRDGLDKINKFGIVLCRTVQTFKPLLLAKYPGNATILALIVAIEGVCALLPDVQNEFLDPIWDNEIPSDDPENTPGINPGLDPAPDPTEP